MATKVDQGDESSNASVPSAEAIRIHHEDDVYITPSTNPAAPTPGSLPPGFADPTAAPPAPFPVPVPTGAPSTNGTSIGNRTADLSNIEGATYFKNPTEAMIARSRHSQKTSAGIMFVRTATDSYRGKFTVAKTIYATHVMSADTIDLSHADFVRPVTKIVAVAVMGNVKVIVPRGVRVQTSGLGIMGEFRGVRAGQSLHAGRDAPLVIVEGSAIMGKAEVRVNEKVPPVLVVD